MLGKKPMAAVSIHDLPASDLGKESRLILIEPQKGSNQPTLDSVPEAGRVKYSEIPGPSHVHTLGSV